MDAYHRKPPSMKYIDHMRISASLPMLAPRMLASLLPAIARHGKSSVTPIRSRQPFTRNASLAKEVQQVPSSSWSDRQSQYCNHVCSIAKDRCDCAKGSPQRSAQTPSLGRIAPQCTRLQKTSTATEKLSSNIRQLEKHKYGENIETM